MAHAHQKFNLEEKQSCKTIFNETFIGVLNEKLPECSKIIFEEKNDNFSLLFSENNS